jgi:hypothetical protein
LNLNINHYLMNPFPNVVSKESITFYVRVQVLTTVSMKFRIFWAVAPCSHVEVDRRFTGAYCLHHQCDDGTDGGSMHLRNVGQLQRDYMELHPEVSELCIILVHFCYL